MTCLSFSFQGEAMGEPRPRFTTVAGFPKAYEPVEAKKMKGYIRLKAELAKKDVGLGTGLIEPSEQGFRVSLMIYKGIPKSFSKKRREMAIEGKIRPITKPDLDNVAKLIIDALTEVIWLDDRLITSLTIAKYYSPSPHTDILISW